MGLEDPGLKRPRTGGCKRFLFAIAGPSLRLQVTYPCATVNATPTIGAGMLLPKVLLNFLLVGRQHERRLPNSAISKEDLCLATRQMKTVEKNQRFLSVTF